MNRTRVIFIAALLLAGVSGATTAAGEDEPRSAIFAGGCFWCMQPPFDELGGVLDTEVGFTGGHVPDPDYDRVVRDRDTGHVEAVRVEYDPDRIDYGQLLYVFWRNIDPLDDGGQFCDRGEPYQAAIFVANEEEERQARDSKQALEDSGRFDEPIVTPIRERVEFYPADASHQDYYRENPWRYRFYTRGCGRYERLDEIWGEEARAGREGY